MDAALDTQGVVALLARAGADRLAHPGGSLLDHLRRTATTLESWGAEPVLIRAGLCHAAYGTAGFPNSLFDLGAREQLRQQLGDAVEAIVYAYCALDRGHARTNNELRDRFNGEYWLPSQHSLRQLAELTIANELDVAEHAELTRAELTGLYEFAALWAGDVSVAGWSALCRAAHAHAITLSSSAPCGDPDLAYRVLGSSGPSVLFWHGGAGPELTWVRQVPLSAEFSLRVPWRRGFAPSRAGANQDWELDARDLLRVMPVHAHVVAHSYGGVSALIAACQAPHRFASLTVIEAPLWSVLPHDAEVLRVVALARDFLRGAPEARDAFLALAGLPIGHEDTLRVERLARGVRDPGEAAPDLARLRAAGLPIAIASGAHNVALERTSDALAHFVAGQRWVLPGAGHAVQRSPEFNQRLRGLIAASSVGERLPLTGRTTQVDHQLVR